MPIPVRMAASSMCTRLAPTTRKAATATTRISATGRRSSAERAARLLDRWTAGQMHAARPPHPNPLPTGEGALSDLQPSAFSLQPREASGFTLIEVLVVIVIIGVIVSVVTLSVGVLGRDEESEDEARRLWTVLQQAREEGEMQARDIGVFVSRNEYEFLRFDN